MKDNKHGCSADSLLSDKLMLPSYFRKRTPGPAISFRATN